MQRRRSTVVGVLLAALLCLALPASQLAIAGDATIVCCCGPHDAAHACGCEDCPVLDQAGDDDAGGCQLRAASCDMDVDRGVAPAPVAALLPAPFESTDRSVTRRSLPAHASRLSTRAIAPPCPDG